MVEFFAPGGGSKKSMLVVSTVVSGVLFARFSTVECILSELSFSIGTFLNNYDVIEESYKPC